MGCLQCCMFSEGTSARTNKKGRGKFNLLACLSCRGNKVMCCFCNETLGSDENEHKSFRVKKIMCCFCSCCSQKPSTRERENKSGTCCSSKIASEPREKENREKRGMCCGRKKHSEPEEKENKSGCFSCCGKKSSKPKEKENKSGRARRVMHSSSFCNNKRPSESPEKNTNFSVKPMESNEEIRVAELKEEIQVVEVKEEIRVNKSLDEKKKKQKRLKKEGKRGSPLSCLVCGRKGCCCTKPSGDEINKESGNERNVEDKKKRAACFCCVKSSKENQKPSKKKKEPTKGSQLAFLVHNISFKSDGSKHRSAAEDILRSGNGNIAARTFQFHELSVATKNFKAECLLGEGGFGRVYKGKIEDSDQIVAVKQLDRNGFQGNREFLVEVLMLSLLHHPNLVKLLGYCADGDQRILVYEYMPLGSLEDQLFAPTLNKALGWNTRMKIALGSARGLEYLHDVANPPVIYRDFKASNILLDEEYNSKLSDFGLAKLGPVGDKSHVSTRVMGTYGYCAPEYAMTGKLTKMSDVYSFGVVFLEMITGRRAIDISRPPNEQHLINWAGPLFRDKTKFVKMADPLLLGRYPLKGLYQALAVASMCLQDESTIRPRISDVVTALEYLVLSSDDQTVALKEYAPLEAATPGLVLEENVDGIDKIEEILQSPPNREDEICDSGKEPKQGVDVT